MKIDHFAAPELKHDPYEETCDGSHDGERVEISTGNLTLVVQEVKSGLGPYFVVHAKWKDLTSRHISFGVHDDAAVDGMFP